MTVGGGVTVRWVPSRVSLMSEHPPCPLPINKQKGTVTAKTVVKDQKDARSLLSSPGNIFTEHNGELFTVYNCCMSCHYLLSLSVDLGLRPMSAVISDNDNVHIKLCQKTWDAC